MDQTPIAGFQLSPQQRHLWLAQHTTTAPLYTQCVMRITGTLDPAVLHDTLNRAVERHEILRTTFHTLPGMQFPLQVIAEPQPLTIQQVDRSAFTTAEQTAQIERLLQTLYCQPFDPALGPLLQVALIECKHDDHLLVLQAPMLLADAAALRLLAQEIGALYAALLRRGPLPDEPPQYVDLSDWLNELITSEETAAGRAFWQQQARSGLRALTLPFADANVSLPFTPDAITLPLSAAITSQLASFVEQQALTAEATLLAGWLVLLWRYSSQTDLVVALASEGRKYDELAQSPGLFATDLPLHHALDPHMHFVELARQVQQAAQTANEWQEFFAWDYLADTLTASSGRVLPFGFAYTVLPAPFAAADLACSIERQTSAVAPCLLRLACEARGATMQLTLHYDAARCAAADVAGMAETLQTLLAQVLARPTAPLAAYALTDTQAAQRLIALLNPRQPQPASGPWLHLRFAAQAQRTPTAIALVDGDQQLTYRELDERANQLAHHLHALELKPDSCVALCLDRSLYFIVALLGVLKAGAAYVPLDPALPAERLQLMLDDVRPRAILSRQSLLANLPASDVRTLCLDRDWQTIAAAPRTAPRTTIDGANLAYVLFTSGSTGRPKGVAVEHRQVSAYLDAITARLDLPGPAHFALVSTIAADLGNTSIFPALTSGGCLHLISAARAADAAAFGEYLARHPIDCIKIVPSHLRALLSGSDPARLLPRQRLILGGEAANWAWARQLQALLPDGARMLNHYGPTETTVGVLTLIDDPAQPPNSATMPLGHPLAFTHSYVLDAQMQPVPTWVAGELYIGGATVSRGYLERPELTAERFVPDPFGTTPGARVYRTGDLVRGLPDGTIAFVGRVDFQVKLRGFRVELGEIEAVLGQHPQVGACVVVAREEQDGDQRLVAYLVEHYAPKSQTHHHRETGAHVEALDPGKLRAFLSERLPEYMLPSAFVVLDTLPLTANGKLDRQALPAPQPQSAQRVVVAPRTPEEELMADLWRQVLNVEPISRDDNFFALGGHSLLATQLIARIRAAFQVELPLRALFEAPMLVEMVAQVTSLRASSGPPSAPIQPAPRTSALPLSLAQQGLWFIAQLAPESAAYTMPMPLRVRGPLDHAALQHALDALIERHETLRTTFIAHDGQPLQVIAPTQSIAVGLHDLQALAPDEQAAAVVRLAAQDAGAPFDLEHGPLLRATLLQLGPAEHVLLLAIHHLIGDGWSLRVLGRELATLYLSSSRKLPAALPALPIQYADYALWQRDWIQAAARDKMLSYWRQQLVGAPPLLALPTDYPRPEVARYAGATYSFTLPLPLAVAAHQLSHHASVTPFMVYLATFQILLARWSGHDDIVVGTPSANRARVETEGLIGLFLNTLALRTRLHDQPSFATLLQRVREMTLGAFAHQALPFDQIVEAVQPRRDLRYNPLFQVLFMFQNIPTPPVELPELSVELLEVDSGTSMLDLTFALIETEVGLYGTVEYNTDLFAPTTIERLVAHYATLLERLAAQPEQPIASVSLLTDREVQQLAAWNATDAAYPATSCLHTLIEEQALRVPQQLAVVCEGGDNEGAALTYAELDTRSNQVAHQLRAVGVSADALVGVCLERGVDLVVALLGVLKAGGAYLPLDPSYPAERLNYMLTDSQAVALISHESLLGALPDLPLALVCLDRDRAVIERQPSTSPATTALPDTLAYVIYTSGSTGQPKGVTIPHRAVVNFLHAMRRAPGITEHDRLLAVTTLSFDIAALEIFLPLLVGGRVVLASRAVATDGAQLAAAIERHGVTMMQATPATWRMLLDTGWTGKPNLTIVCGGEALLPELAEALLARSAALWNLYGPTETTIWSAATPIVGNRSITIGPPIANTQLYLVDQQLQPVPIGVPGELYIGGAGVARGYHRRPELTAERFLPDPFGTTPGARLYRSGDLARWLPDGRIDFLGRIDHQIKLRGFRIELGEIEAALNHHPDVQQSVVLLREDQAGDQRLVAYLVERQDRNIDRYALRAFLAEQLPAYMLPSAYVILDAWPRTPNNKIDRQALPAPGALAMQPGTHAEAAFVAPRTPTEAELAGIWSTVLDHAPIGIHDDFFELGGHSLLVTQLVSRVRDTFGIELPLRSVFEAPSVAGLARRIDAARQTAQGLIIPPLLPTARHTAPPLSFAQQRLWFLDQLMPNNPFYTIATAVRMTGRLNAQMLAQSLATIAQRHESLRTTFAQAADGRAVQMIAPDLALNIATSDLQALPEPERLAEIERLSTAEAQQPFDLRHGPLIRATLLQAGPTEHVLLLTMHHSISDGWSMGVLVQELASIYRALASGETVAAALLPALPVQYADYALWQREWLAPGAASGSFEQQMAYWKRQLANLPTLDLPSDRARPPLQSFKGAALRFKLPAPLTEALRALSRREGVTLFMTLLTGFKILLARWSGQQDIVVGTPIAGRTRAEVEHLIGFFVNTLVLRTDLSGQPSARTLLKRVQASALDAYAHQDLPFELVVDQVQPERDMSRNPLFQVLFALQNMPMPTIELPDLTLHSLPADSATAKFDLWLSLREGPDTLYGTMEYSTDLFDHSTIERMIDHFHVLLTAITADPERPVMRLPLIPAVEQQRMLVEWNRLDADTPPPVSCLHQLFEAQVERAPHLIAVIDNTTRLSYATINQRANQVAHRLRALGVGPDVPVGVCLERSADLIIAVLGVLKAGGAYLPLDTSYPVDRLQFMLHDAGASILITEQALLHPEHSRFSALPPHTICLDSEHDTLAQEPIANLNSGVTLDHLAYLIYTSGSTGLPKGVPISHRSPVNLVHWSQQHYQPAQLAGVLFATSICFDLSVWELFVPLSRGGSVIVAKNALHLPELPAAHEVTLINTVPSAAAELLRIDGIPSSVATVNLAGEPLPLQLAQQLYEREHIRQVVNLYGPSETTTYSSWAVVARNSMRMPPIGRPIAATQIYLVDHQLQPVPIGAAGELLIGGDGVARGYLKRPALTAERFIPDPFGATHGARLYRTGDLARFLADGTIDYLGRIDQQVKVRGFRIELGEIETTLRQHPAVQDAVALAWTNAAGTKRLAAYVVPEQEQADNSAGAAQATAANGKDELLASWQHVFNSTYQQPVTPDADTFDIAGWNSSYTGEPLPAAEMHEWVDQTVARIRALAPRRVLEIGCGTGLLLLPLAPHCEAYWGTDFSPTVIEQLRQRVAAHHLPQVTLRAQAADDCSGLRQASFDLVIINSVAQYFPNIEYLLRVLDSALDLLNPGGQIFLGDLRSLPLLNAFHAAVELSYAPDTLTTTQLQQRVQRRLLQEQELVIDPALFGALNQRLPRIQHVAIQLKHGTARNELTQFRYDVVLSTGTASQSTSKIAWRDWQQHKLTLAALRHLLATSDTDALGLQHVPNARIAAEIHALELLDSGPPATIGELRALAQSSDHAPAVDPAELWALGAQLGYQVVIGWSSGDAACFDAVFQPVAAAGSAWQLAAQLPLASAPIAPPDHHWHRYANDPLQAKLTRQLVPLLRQHLKERLPDYMLPAVFTLLPTLPLTPNGKIDRQALPEPLFMPELEVDLVLPRTPGERALAAIWAQVLGVEQVGIHNNFFALGGDSILSLQVIAQAQQAGLRITPKQMFQHQTIAELAAVVLPVAAPAAQPEPAAQTEADSTPTAAFPRAKLSQKDLDTLAARLGKSGKRRS